MMANVNVDFMNKKYALSELVSHYVESLRELRSQIKTPIEESKLQIYIQAANVFKNVAIKDIVQFGLSYGRNVSGKASQMREAFPTLLGNRVTQASAIDLAYARILLDYTIAFKSHRSNLKEWMLRFLLSSRFSPLYGIFESEIDRVIDNTKQKIIYYSQNLQ